MITPFLDIDLALSDRRDGKDGGRERSKDPRPSVTSAPDTRSMAWVRSELWPPPMVARELLSMVP